MNASCQSFLHLEELTLSDNRYDLPRHFFLRTFCGFFSFFFVFSLSHIDTASGLFLSMASTSLANLDVSRNRLQRFELPNQMSKLQRLDVSDNKLTSAEVVFEAVRSSRKSIEEIHAQGNQIGSLGSVNYTFDNLLILNLSRNRYFIAKKKKKMFLLSINLRQFLFFFQH